MSSSASSTPTVIPNPSTFSGSTPSAVLFFLAMAVGVAIAGLFVFFTARYFVRSRYGLHIYSLSNRGMLFAPRAASRLTMVAYSDREIYEHLDYLRTHHFLREDFLERRIYTQNARRRRRRRRRNGRRGRFSKMKKLTADEVEKLFPPCSYATWLRADADSLASKDAPGEGAVTDSASVSAMDSGDIRLDDLAAHSHGADEKNGVKELHFDSGMCSICLEVFEPEDGVRGLICGHVYHVECVDPWLIRRRACCPICKRDYYSNDAGSPGAVPIIQEQDESGDENEENGGNGGGDDGGEIRGESGENREIGNQAQETDGNQAQETDGNQAQETQETNQNPRSHIPTTQAAPEVNSDHDSIGDLNYDYIRGDSNMQALFNELVPISERVRVILDENPDLDLDARARDIASRKYGSVFRRVFWRVMGISRDDIYYWAVLRTFHADSTSNRERASTSADGANPETDPVHPETDTASPETDQANASGLAHVMSEASGLDHVTSGAPRQDPSREANGSALSLPPASETEFYDAPTTGPRDRTNAMV